MTKPAFISCIPRYPQSYELNIFSRAAKKIARVAVDLNRMKVNIDDDPFALAVGISGKLIVTRVDAGARNVLCVYFLERADAETALLLLTDREKEVLIQGIS